MDSAPLLVIPSQYQGQRTPVSDGVDPAVSRRITLQINGSSGLRESGDFQLDPLAERMPDRQLQIAAGQYQQDSDEPKRRLMLVIGVAFGAAYAVFVAGWIWATRFRSRTRRH
jgi:hypothetical protein